MIGACWGLPAHEFFAGCVQHRLELSANKEHIDLKVQLRFFEYGSEHERGDMDTDRDGRVSRREIMAYLKAHETVFSKAVTLRVDAKPVPLLTLYPAELDVLGNNKVGRGHHLLTLHYFARIPPDLKVGTELVIEDRLWRQIAAVATFHTKPNEGPGWKLEAMALEDILFAPAKAEEGRVFKARVVEGKS